MLINEIKDGLRKTDYIPTTDIAFAVSGALDGTLVILEKKHQEMVYYTEV